MHAQAGVMPSIHKAAGAAQRPTFACCAQVVEQQLVRLNPGLRRLWACVDKAEHAQCLRSVMLSICTKLPQLRGCSSALLPPGLVQEPQPACSLQHSTASALVQAGLVSSL